MTHFYIDLARSIHQDNIDAGWWKQKPVSVDPFMDSWTIETQPRNVGELIALVHSEISEGYLGHARDLKDDHLPQYPMWLVEMADTAIRIFDMLGFYTEPRVEFQEFEGLGEMPIGFTFGDITLLNHLLVSEALESFRKDDILRAKMKLWCVLDCLYQSAEAQHYDLNEIIEAKRVYNRNRADHKLEARQAEGGKKF